MTTADAPTPAVDGPAPQLAPSEVRPEAPPAPAPDPGLIAMPMFAVGAISLALFLLEFIPADAAASIAPALLATTGLGLTFAAIWAASLGAGVVASVFATLAGFWSSLALFLLGAANGWFSAEPLESAVATRPLEAFLIAWLAVFVMVTLVTLRLPSAFTLFLVLVDAAVALVLAGTAADSEILLNLGGVAVLGFVGVGAYLFAGAASAGTGGPPLPSGRPVIR